MGLCEVGVGVLGWADGCGSGFGDLRGGVAACLLLAMIPGTRGRHAAGPGVL